MLQRLLVPRCSEQGLTAAFLPQHEIHPPRGVLLRFVERQDPRGAMLDLVRENRFCSIDKVERCFSCWLGRGGVDGPQHRLQLVETVPAAGLELLLEGAGLEAPQDLCIGSLSLSIALWVCY